MPDQIKAGVRTAVISFVVLFGGSLVGWLNDIQSALDSGGSIEVDLSTLGKAALSAVAAAAIGLVNVVVNWGQSKTGVGSTPTYSKES